MQAFTLRTVLGFNLLSIFAVIHRIAGGDLPWNLGVHEASQERIQRVIDGEWIELPNNKVECWYPDTVKNVVEGKGSTIQREEHVQSALKAWKAGIEKDPSDFMKTSLGWTDSLSHLELPSFLSASEYGNPELVVFKKNDFPWRLSKDVEHHVMWFRPPLVTPAAFKRMGRDRAYPSHDFKNMKDPRGDALIEYLNENDIYGWTGLPPSAVSPFRQSSELHPMEAIWRSQSGEPISREQAAEAIRWVARHTNRLIEKQFPPLLYETVWNRTNYRVRSILEPNHIHVLVIPKTSPHSYFSQYLRSLTLHGYGGYALRARKKYKKTIIKDVLPQKSYNGYNLRARKNYDKTISKDIFHQELAT